MASSRTQEEWTNYAKMHRRYYFFFEGKVLDLTDFTSLHPGGKKALTNYVFKDITDIIFKVYPHKRDTTTRVLNRYVVGALDSSNKERKSTPQQGKVEKSPFREKKKVCFGEAVKEEAEEKHAVAPKAHKKKSKSGGSPNKKSNSSHQNNPFIRQRRGRRRRAGTKYPLRPSRKREILRRCASTCRRAARRQPARRKC